LPKVIIEPNNILSNIEFTLSIVSAIDTKINDKKFSNIDELTEILDSFTL
jgi:hypothetical protein